MRELLSCIATERSEQAFRRLFDELAPRVRAYMMRQGADQATAEDLVQETLLTVWSKASLYSADKGALTTWVFRIARNLRISRLRREVSWQELSDEMAEVVPCTDPGPDEEVVQREREQRVQAALARLPTDQRNIVNLAFVDGLSHNEIARHLALPLGTVKSRLRLAYQKVRDSVEDMAA